MNIGPLELGILFLIVLLVFGAKRLPELARSIGTSARALKQGLQGPATCPNCGQEVEIDSTAKGQQRWLNLDGTAHLPTCARCVRHRQSRRRQEHQTIELSRPFRESSRDRSSVLA